MDHQETFYVVSSIGSTIYNDNDNRKRRKKMRSKTLNEVERLAEIERQRRQKEAEQKIIEEAAKRIEGAVSSISINTIK